jgi:hypothetical protein
MAIRAIKPAPPRSFRRIGLNHYFSAWCIAVDA